MPGTLAKGQARVDRILRSFSLKKLRELCRQRVLVTGFATGQALNAAELARSFKGGGKKIEQRVTQALTTLVRYGRATDLGNGRDLARKAA